MGQAHPYNQFFTSLAAKAINIGADTFKLQLHTKLYLPNKGTHRFQSDLTNELPAGSGYTTGGNTLSGLTVNVTNTNAVQTIPAQGAPFTITTVINGQTLTTASITAGAAAALVQAALEVTLGVGNVTVAGTGPYTVTFVGTLGAQAITLMTTTPVSTVVNTTPGAGTFFLTPGTNVTWPAATFPPANAPRYGVIIDTTPGSAAANPLVAIEDYIYDQQPNNATLANNWDPAGLLSVAVA